MSGCRSATRLTMGMEVSGPFLVVLSYLACSGDPAQHPKRPPNRPIGTPEPSRPAALTKSPRRRSRPAAAAYSGRRAPACSLNKMRPRWCGLEPIREILRLVGHQPLAKFHDAHRIGRDAVIAEHEFGDPEIAPANNSPDHKTLLVWLDEPARLNVAPAADPFSLLRIIRHGILAVDFMFCGEIVSVRGIPVTLQRRTHRLIIHLVLPSKVPAIIRAHGESHALLHRSCQRNSP